jgi:polyferredoxin
VFQAGFLLLFLGLMLLGWGRFAPEGVASKLFAKSNLVTLLVWGLWWPAMVWVAVGFGRVWCLVCPLELVSNGAERAGRRTGLRQLKLKGWVAAGGLIAGFYFVIQMCVAGIELHRTPAYTSVFLAALLTGALLTGLFLKDRAFCRGFCPVGLLLNVYGRGGMVAVRPKAPEPCRTCDGRECKTAARRDALDARSCPSLLNPARLDTNADCLVCCQCLKACEPDNLALVVRPPFSARDARPVLASWPVTLFVMLVSGFVTYELCSEWKAAQAVFLSPVEWLGRAFGLGAGVAGWFKGAYVLLAVPAGIWFAAGTVTKLLGGARSLGEAWRRLALPLAVVISAGHMAKGLAKVVSWGGFLPGALQEPSGVQTALALTAKTLAQPPPWMSLSVVSVVGVGLLGCSLWLAVREARLADMNAVAARSVPVVGLGAGYLFLIAGWGWQ